MATTIRHVTLKPLGKNKDIDPSKGTVVNPFTQAEYNNLCHTGEWTGGYVETMGYVAPPMMDGMGDSWGSGSGSSDSPYPQIEKEFNTLALNFDFVEGIGIQATFACHCSFRISGYTMTVWAEILPPQVSGREYYANVEVKEGDKQQTYQLQRHGTYITNPGCYVIGDVSFDLPKSGNAIVKLIIGYIYNSGLGYSGRSGSAQLLPLND